MSTHEAPKLTKGQKSNAMAEDLHLQQTLKGPQIFENRGVSLGFRDPGARACGYQKNCTGRGRVEP